LFDYLVLVEGLGGLGGEVEYLLQFGQAFLFVQALDCLLAFMVEL
jgi:hypothetical protein